MTAASPSLPAASDSADRPVIALVRDGAIAGVLGAAAATLVAYGAKALDVPMMAAPQTASAGEPLPMAAFATSTLMATVIGVLLALGLLRWAPRPRATFVVVTVVLTVLSATGPITTGYATTATRVVLMLTHIVAAAIIIPIIARRLPAANAR